MQLSREEFWILDPTVDWNADLPLHCLFFYPNRIYFLNKRSDIGLSEETLVELLVFMQKQGIMAVFQQKDRPHPLRPRCFRKFFRSPLTRTLNDYTWIWENPVFYPRSAIRDDFSMIKEHGQKNGRVPHPPETLCYCMTPQGGERWEETVKVDWSKYLDRLGDWVKDADVAKNQSLMFHRAASVSEEVLDAYFTWKTRWDAHFNSLEARSFHRYHTERISPWRATYWKTFPVGFECDYTEFSTHFDLQRHRESGLTDEEEKRYQLFYQESSREYDLLFDWRNNSVEDFPFEGD